MMQHRFQSLPFGIERVQRHINAGDTTLVSFICTYDRFMIARRISRPLCRDSISRGDTGVYEGFTWSVVLACDQIAIVEVWRPGARQPVSVEVDTLARRARDPPQEVAGLFVSADEVWIWDVERRVDLWDWIEGVPFTCGLGRVTVRRDADDPAAWLVETEKPAATLSWAPGEGVRLLAGAMPPLDELFVTPPPRL
jgi:hypothetical protein